MTVSSVIRRPLRPLGVAAILVALVGATPLVSSAGAATQIGQTLTPNFGCSGPSTYFQKATAAGAPSYNIPATGGVITSWSTQALTGGAQVKLGILHPTGTPNQYTTVTSSSAETIQASQLNTFNTRLPVGGSGSDTIALLIFSGIHDCASTGAGGPGDVGERDAAAVHDTGDTFTYANPNPGTFINVAASLEPDADNDGFGDETQDGCPTDASAQGACPVPNTTITKGPKDKTRKKTATFEFTSSITGSTFECSLDGGAFAPCSSPHSVKVKKGKHTFAVRATSKGETDATPATDDWKVKKKKKKKK